MNLGNILGQILQQGMASQSRARLDHAVGSNGIGDLLGGLLGGAQGAGSARQPAGPGGLGDLLGGVLGGSRSGGAGALGDLLGGVLGGSAGGRPAAPSGGLGDLLGGLLGGTQGTAPRRSGSTGGNAGMAILATIAMAALKNWTDKRREQADSTGAMAGFAPEDVQAMTAPEAEALIVRAMISASKADGEVSEEEVQRIVGKLGADGLSEEERQFILSELRRPLDIAGLVRDVPNAAVAAEIYAASLLSIDIDTPAEVAYLRQLAQALHLDAGTVSRLHQITGATAV
ncbi:tellurite resistance TerB family protein [Thauera sp. AutoDN2]|uniref:tellurite resistance TerB family protein n=1 Tax=Thauera sp. AutoDN2 TaxID=3416051 RepID=UPI002A38BCAB|nr:tellurite resistance TerB family protein [Thauera sp.]